LFVYGITYVTGPPANTSLCEICIVQRGVGAQISRAATREKAPSDLLANADGLAVNTSRLKAVELSSHQTPWKLS
jgi:hypothetical protein